MADPDANMSKLAFHKTKAARLRSKAQQAPDGAVVLAASNYTSLFLDRIYSYQKDGTFCDFVIRLDDCWIPVHRLVLSATSGYFQALFQSGMMESEQGFVTLGGLKENAMRVLIRYMYVGRISLTKDSVTDVLEAASRLQVESALKLCSTYLENVVSEKNCVDIYNLADKYSLLRAKERTFTFMALKFLQISDEQFECLTFTQLLELVESNCLLTNSEWDVFEKVLKWLETVTDPQLKEAALVPLMQAIRFPLMSPSDLVNKVTPVTFMTGNAECSKLLNEAKDYHLVKRSQPCVQTPRTQVRHANIIYMAICEDSNFYVYPMFDPAADCKVHSDPVELKRPPASLVLPSVCVYRNFLYVCGGVHDRRHPDISTALCFRYDPRMDSWYQIASMNEARQAFHLQVCGLFMFAFGGEDELGVSKTYDVYSFIKDEWTAYTLPQGFHSARRYASVALGDSIYISGGSLGSYVCSDMVEYYHNPEKPGMLTVRKLPNMHVGRKRHIMLAEGTKIFAIGGLTDSIEVFDTFTQRWTLYKGFDACSGDVHYVLGCCSLDPKRVILGFVRDRVQHIGPRKTYFVLIDLTADPADKEKFMKTLGGASNIRKSATSFGLQLLMPAGEVVSRKATSDSREDQINVID